MGNMKARVGEFEIDEKEKDLGMTIDEFEKYIEKQFRVGMCWKNYGVRWELDHIIPVSYIKKEEYTKLTKEKKIKIQQAICHYTNIQPLFNNENAKKRDNITEEIQEKIKTILS
jgi:hypothetical protein